MSLNVGGRAADVTPLAASLVEGLRDIGYSLETALADVIDNAITAKARRVEILTETAVQLPSIAILDDGEGMTEEELIAAMRPGSRNPIEERDHPDLGRFGLGMKSASFSQCRRLTVFTRKNGITSGAVWDLDVVAVTNQWTIELLDDAEKNRWAQKLAKSGTLVLWEKLDRLAGGVGNDVARQSATINQRLADAERHIRLVFHRFMELPKPLRILLNGRSLKPINPFAKDNSTTIKDPEETLPLARGDVVIQSYTLPHHKDMSQTAWEEISGPEGHLKSQGFYIYRGKRLILYGTWFGLARQSELTKLCRVRVDIPNSMDAEWKIDVKKSSAQLPPIVRDRLKKVIERIYDGSKRTYRRRGQKLVDASRMPMWNRIQVDGMIRYRPNTDHPTFVDYAEELPEGLRRGFFNCISLVGASLPIDTLHTDMAGHAEQIAADVVDEDTLVQAVQSTLRRLLERNFGVKEITSMLRDIEPFRSAWEDTQRIIRTTLEIEAKL